MGEIPSLRLRLFWKPSRPPENLWIRTESKEELPLFPLYSFLVILISSWLTLWEYTRSKCFQGHENSMRSIQNVSIHYIYREWFSIKSRRSRRRGGRDQHHSLLPQAAHWWPHKKGQIDQSHGRGRQSSNKQTNKQRIKNQRWLHVVMNPVCRLRCR